MVKIKIRDNLFHQFNLRSIILHSQLKPPPAVIPDSRWCEALTEWSGISWHHGTLRAPTPITANPRLSLTRFEREPKIFANEFNETPQSIARVSVFHLSPEFSNLNFDSPSMYSALHDKGFDTSSCRRGRRPSLFEPLRVFVNEDVYDPLTPG